MSELKVNKISPRSGTELTLSDNLLFDTASKGIYLGVTTATASNLLGDYEKGTWTPAIDNFTLGNGGMTGEYVKVGSLVLINMKLTWGSTSSSTGRMRIGGLPFTVERPGNGTIWMFDSGSGAYIYPATMAQSSSTNFRIKLGSSNEMSNIDPFTWTTSDRMDFSATYQSN